MDIAQARTFLEIAETGSFIAAAGRLNVTQTAVSARIRALEDQLGRRLFVRNKSGARLTPAGGVFCGTRARWCRSGTGPCAGRPAAGHTDIVSVGAEISLWIRSSSTGSSG